MRKKKKLLYSAIVLAVALLSAVFSKLNTPPADPDPQPPVSSVVYTDSDAYVEMIDVGQGDCTLLRSGEYAMLIDVGERSQIEHILDTLRRSNITRLEMVIISHPHTDHMGALVQLMDEVEVENVLIDTVSPDGDDDTEEYNRIIDACEDKGVTLLSRDEYETIGFDCFRLELLPEYPTPSDTNDRSIVVRATCDGVSFLFTGDMTSKYEEYLLDIGADVSCDVLKLAHHGSRYSNNSDFLYTTGAKLCLVGCAEDNRYGHPHEESVSRLNEAGITIYRTDLHGNIRINAETLGVKTNA